MGFDYKIVTRLKCHGKTKKELLSSEHSGRNPRDKASKDKSLTRGTQSVGTSLTSQDTSSSETKEWALLLYQQPRLQSRADLIQEVWGGDWVCATRWVPGWSQCCRSVDHALSTKILNQMWKTELHLTFCGKEWGNLGSPEESHSVAKITMIPVVNWTDYNLNVLIILLSLSLGPVA